MGFFYDSFKMPANFEGQSDNFCNYFDKQAFNLLLYISGLNAVNVRMRAKKTHPLDNYVKNLAKNV